MLLVGLLARTAPLATLRLLFLDPLVYRNDDARIYWRGLHELETRLDAPGEQPLALAQDQRVDQQVELIDEVGCE